MVDQLATCPDCRTVGRVIVIEGRGYLWCDGCRTEIGMLELLGRTVEDPDDRPYLWDLDED